ncbi:unnamed protein product [Soboliphyme baturini]|uniref:PH domain-containing protein n=1 Tax=Soboliphyme baturini TaxID=241478 RepID=A0A183ILQ9_9BILA|nr:unnamed protein product [Soboliphyme baturini]
MDNDLKKWSYGFVENEEEEGSEEAFETGAFVVCTKKRRMPLAQIDPPSGDLCTMCVLVCSSIDDDDRKLWTDALSGRSIIEIYWQSDFRLLAQNEPYLEHYFLSSLPIFAESTCPPSELGRQRRQVQLIETEVNTVQLRA